MSQAPLAAFLDILGLGTHIQSVSTHTYRVSLHTDNECFYTQIMSVNTHKYRMFLHTATELFYTAIQSVYAHIYSVSDTKHFNRERETVCTHKYRGILVHKKTENFCTY